MRAISCSSQLLAENPMSDRRDPDERFAKRAKNAVAAAVVLCRAHEFADAEQVANRAHYEMSYPREYPAIRSEVKHVADAICDELKKRQFVAVSPNLVRYIDRVAWIGDEVTDAFEDASDDVYNAGNCLATECGTAAVFHLMRVVEWGLRYLCVHMGLKQAKNRNGKLVPITYTEWETMLNQLRLRIDAKIEKMSRGPKKQQAQEFYYPALQDIQGIRDAWRNHLMHVRRDYTIEDAEAIAQHVKRLMMSLAMKKRGGPPLTR